MSWLHTVNRYRDFQQNAGSFIGCIHPLQRPLDTDLMVDLTNDGIRLIFEASCQRLKVSLLFMGDELFQFLYRLCLSQVGNGLVSLVDPLNQEIVHVLTRTYGHIPMDSTFPCQRSCESLNPMPISCTYSRMYKYSSAFVIVLPYCNKTGTTCKVTITCLGGHCRAPPPPTPTPLPLRICRWGVKFRPLPVNI